MFEKVLASIELDELLKNTIINSIPDNYNDEEKVLHIYFLLGKIFSYSKDYYVENDRYYDYFQVSNMNKLNYENNKVNCYVINTLFAKLLSEIGVVSFPKDEDKGYFSEYDSEYCFMDEHFSLVVCIYGRYYDFDLISSFYTSSMLNSKINGELPKVEIPFKEKVFNYVEELIPSLLNYEELINNYMEEKNNNIKFTNYDIIRTILSLVGPVELNEIELIYLIDKLFLDLTIVSGTTLSLTQMITDTEELVLVFYDNDDYIYYYQLNTYLKEMSYEELQNLINAGDVKFIKKYHQIPGILSKEEYENSIEENNILF